MTTTEINTLVSSLGQDCGKYEDILCKAAHHEEVSSSYKIDGDPIVVRHPHLALSIAGTQEQFRNFFRSLEVGLYSRFGIYTRQQSQLWESCAPQEGEVDLHSYFYGLGSELFEMHKLLLQSPTLVTFSPQQWQQHTAHFSLLLKRTLLEGRESSSGIVYRNGLLAMRLAAILTISGNTPTTLTRRNTAARTMISGQPWTSPTRCSNTVFCSAPRCPTPVCRP